jgi:RNA-directed DNA polymerase
VHQPASPAEWEQWLAATRKAITKQAIITVGGGTPNDHQPRLIHAHCQQRHGISPDLLQPVSLPSRLA